MDFWSWRGGVFEFVRATSPVTPTFGAIRIEPAVVRRDDSELGKKSLELQQEIAELMAEDADSPLLGSLYQDLGLVERDRGDWDAAERWTRQALTIYERIGNRQRLVLCWGVLGDIENNRGNWNAAERLYRQSLQLREELGDRSGIAVTTCDRGVNELGRGNLEAAEKYLNDAL
jgi:tetratricopeptide (TPR) repeat protein